jgi:lipopolysaccharide transport system ATP-binding protein
MREAAVIFDGVWKSYPSYFHTSGGIKSFLFNLPKALRELNSRRTALEDVSFEIHKGENFGFIGKNGAGKSTTLGLIAGVLSPERGSIHVNGRVSPLLELGAGFHPELSGRANILLNGVLMGLTKKEVLSREQEIIEFSELGDFIDQPVRIYSSGMFAKLGFAVVAILKPEIILLDEVLAVGDIAFQQKCKTVFENFKSNPQVTMILVSHSLESVKSFCQRAAWIENKCVKLIGPAEDVVDEYTKANIFQIQMPDDMHGAVPPHIRVGTGELDCSEGAADFFPELFSTAPETKVRITLSPCSGSGSVSSWLVSPQALSLRRERHGFFLESADGARLFSFPGEDDSTGDLGFEKPFIMSLQAEVGDVLQGAAIWLPVYGSNAARGVFERQKTQLMTAAMGGGFPPYLWPGGKTVRIVARNIITRDAIGNFTMEIAATLKNYGIPVRLYAYASCPELAGLVSPIGELWRQVEFEDVVFYHYSTEDEFLPQISKLVCARKILYYHNVTPGRWFADSLPEFAETLDRARDQYSFFSTFDAVAANSGFSLQDVLPYIGKETPATVFPPTMAPDRLTRIVPEPVVLPRGKRIILWVGRVAPHKRPELAVAVCEQLFAACDDVVLVMVASGRRDFSQITERFENVLHALPAGTREKIYIKEDLSDAELAYVYAKAALLLCTSGHEGYCLPVNEALRFGLPVASFPQPAVEETMAGQGTILPEDVVEASRIILAILVSLQPQEKIPVHSSEER